MADRRELSVLEAYLHTPYKSSVSVLIAQDGCYLPHEHNRTTALPGVSFPLPFASQHIPHTPFHARTTPPPTPSPWHFPRMVSFCYCNKPTTALLNVASWLTVPGTFPVEIKAAATILSSGWGVSSTNHRCSTLEPCRQAFTCRVIRERWTSMRVNAPQVSINCSNSNTIHFVAHLLCETARRGYHEIFSGTETSWHCA